MNGIEGQDFHIKCAAKGVQPFPYVTLKVRNQEVKKGNQNIVCTIPQITRYFYNASVECVANDSALSRQLSTEAYIFLSRQYTLDAL